MHKILHTQRFLQQQGMRVETPTLHQDNKSTILLHEKGRSSLGKWMRHIEMRYFFINDQVQRGNIKIAYFPASEMYADYMSKPLQGILFKRFRKSILGM